MRRYRARLKLALLGGVSVLGIAALSVIGALYIFDLNAPVPVGAVTPVPEGDDWIELLDDTNAQLWRYTTDDQNNYEIHDGVLHLFGNAVYPLRYVMYTGQRFGDFELHAEYRLAEGANSGLFLRAQSDDPVERGFEVQILEDHGDAPNNHGSGAIYDVVTPMFNMSLPAGEWNSFDVRVVGTDVEVAMNGWLVVKTDFALMTEPLGKFDMPYAELPREGMIMIQDHGGEAWFRNLRVRAIPPSLESSPLH